MKSNLRKALALLLTLIMVMTSLPTSALAEMVTDLAKSVTDVSEGKAALRRRLRQPTVHCG